MLWLSFILLLLIPLIDSAPEPEPEPEFQDSNESSDISGSDERDDSSFGTRFESLQSNLMAGASLCIDFKIQPHIMTVCGLCIAEAMKTSGMREALAEGTIPVSDLKMNEKLLNSYASCKLKRYKITHNETFANLTDYLEKTDSWNWATDQEDKMAYKRILQKCLREARGDTAIEMVHNMDKCILFEILNHCVKEDDLDDVGHLSMIAATMYSLNEPSKCSSVVVPEQAKLDIIECMDEAKEKFLALNISIRDMPKLHLGSKVFQRHLGPALGLCALKRMGVYNPVSILDVEKAVNIVRQQDGWESIPDKQEQIINAIETCGHLYFPQTPSREINSKEDDGIEEIQEELMEKFIDYDKCFKIKASQICGLRGDYGKYICFLCNPEYTDKVIEIFKEIGGGRFDTLLGNLKEKMKKMEMMLTMKSIE